ncbi:MAG: tRNA preQ1(34) S-adenosylmethionine ribosyltransferase-isomerase QueA [Thiohalobacterales bacterium]
MQRSDFSYKLPEELIAIQPLESRSDSRLLCLDPVTATSSDRGFRNLPEMLEPGDLLVFNNTRVIPARLFGHKQTGGRVEMLIERITGPASALAQLRSSKPVRTDTRIRLGEHASARVSGRLADLYQLEFSIGSDLEAWLEQAGHVPLPPYIKRADGPGDRQRYQTVYARIPGAVAAPTAGLHFDEAILQQLEHKGVGSAFLTLHIGAGTFQPLRTDNLDEHVMHHESFEIGAETSRKINETRRQGGRIVAVGTTVVRTLEAAMGEKGIEPCRGETDLFIRPGYPFKCVDALVTNFHLPESTLLMLVCAFAGHAAVMTAYQHAIRERYRFYSYGDAMFVNRCQGSAR